MCLLYQPSAALQYLRACSEPEEVLLDENKEAAKHAYYAVADVSVSDDGKTVAFSEDTVGSELYSLRVLNATSRKPLLEQPITNTQGQVEWAADSTTFFYVTQDAKQRPYKVCPDVQLHGLVVHLTHAGCLCMAFPDHDTVAMHFTPTHVTCRCSGTP